MSLRRGQLYRHYSNQRVYEITSFSTWAGNDYTPKHLGVVTYRDVVDGAEYTRPIAEFTALVLHNGKMVPRNDLIAQRSLSGVPGRHQQ